MAARLATLLAALLLALGAPAAALGQGAGDDQYSDPFGSGQNDEPAPEEEQEAPEPAQPEPAEPAAPAPAATSSQESSEPQEQLPYTGADEALVALAGAMLLAGGVALRLRLRS